MAEGGKDKHIHTQTDTHINTMTRPGLGAKPSDKSQFLVNCTQQSSDGENPNSSFEEDLEPSMFEVYLHICIFICVGPDLALLSDLCLMVFCMFFLGS